MAREKRAHARVIGPLSGRVTVPGGQEQSLKVRDISRGGVFLYTRTALAQVGEPLDLTLSLPDGSMPVQVGAEVARIVMAPREHGGGILGMGLRFSELGTERARQVDALLDRVLEGSGGEKRAHPRVSRRLEVRCKNRRELHAVLRDIGQGGLSLSVDKPLAQGEAIVVEIDREGPGPLELSGRVVSTEPARPNEVFRRVGVKLELSAQTEAELERFLKKLA